jgi:hypothetical protein
MAFNLRELTNKYGRNKGLNVEAVHMPFVPVVLTPGV